MGRYLDRALPLAALDGVGVLAVPVDEADEVLQVEFDREGEILGGGLERLDAHPVDERVERLAVPALTLVHADPTLHRVRDALRGEADLQALPVLELAIVVAAADVRDVGRHLLVAHLDRRAVEPDRAEVVLAAAVGAAGHLDVDAARQRIVDLHLVEPLRDRHVQAHRARNAELAAVGAGAADHIGDLMGASLAEVQLDEPAPDVVDGLVAHPAEHDVLLDARPRVAAAEVAHDLCDSAELPGRQIAAGHLDLYGREPALALGPRVRRREPLELREVAV